MGDTEDAGHAAAHVGPLEYEVLRALWDGEPANVSAVLASVNDGRRAGDHLAYTTVMTVLARLHDKGMLARQKVGRGFTYRPRFTEPELVEHLGEQAVADLVDRYGPVALAQFAAALQDADPAILRRLTALAEGGDEHDH